MKIDVSEGWYKWDTSVDDFMVQLGFKKEHCTIISRPNKVLTFIRTILQYGRNL